MGRPKQAVTRSSVRTSSTTPPARTDPSRRRRAVRTSFVCDFQDGDVAGQDKESREVRMLALHLPQSVLVHVDTLLMQGVLADPKVADQLTDADRRALSPLCWTHVNP